MECVSRDSSTLEAFPNCECSDEESSLQDDDSKEDPECPKCWEPSIWIAYTSDRSLHDLDHSEYEEYRDSQPRHRLCLSMSVGMIVISRSLCIADSEIYDPRSDDICRGLDSISDECIRVSEYSTEELHRRE